MLANKPLGASMLQMLALSKTHSFSMSNSNPIWPHGGQTKAPTQPEMARVAMELETEPVVTELGPGTEPVAMELETEPVVTELGPGTEPVAMELGLATEQVELGTEPAEMEPETEQVELGMEPETEPVAMEAATSLSSRIS
jgi:hypothetical protein